MVLAFWWWPHAFSAVVAPCYWRFGGGPTLLVRWWPAVLAFWWWPHAFSAVVAP